MQVFSVVFFHHSSPYFFLVDLYSQYSSIRLVALSNLGVKGHIDGVVGT